MMKLLAIVFLVAVANASFLDQSSALVQARGVQSTICSITGTCAAAGAACGLSNNNQNYAICGDGYYCSTDSSTCVALIAVGGTCTLSTAPYCTYDTTCVGGTCQAVTYTVASGGNCNSTNQCNSAALYCAGTCTAFQDTGASCSLSSPCYGIEYCNSGTCAAPFSIAIGSSCANTENCVAGSYCSESTGKCTAGFSSSKKVCNTGSDCTVTDEVCVCSSETVNATAYCTAPTTWTSSQASAATDFYSCVKTNNCYLPDQASGLCSACKSAYCKFYKADATESSLSCLNDQSSISLCGHASSSATMVAASCLVFVAALFAL